MEIAGASPETLVRLQHGVSFTLPLQATKPLGNRRGRRGLENELLSDPKELAEHNMLVDLGRNDLGRISRFGSVTVEKYLNVERFSHVMHLSSTVRGVIREDKSALDAVKAVLPAGTLSGAPKIRACQIIDELENNKRGVYGAQSVTSISPAIWIPARNPLAFKKNGKVYGVPGGA
jgi:anthranilate synthase component 1